MSRGVALWLGIVGMCCLGGGLQGITPASPEAPTTYTASTVDFRDALRKTWAGHVIYTRNFVISLMADLGDLEVVRERIFKNADEIGHIMTPYYGAEAGDKLAKLMREHATIGGQLAAAAKKGDKQEQQDRAKQWHANADAIVSFLNELNPHWSKDTLKHMFYQHLGFASKEVATRAKKDWQGNMEAFEGGCTHILAWANLLWDGVIRQYPEKFKEGGLQKS